MATTATALCDTRASFGSTRSDAAMTTKEEMAK
jgi:hypothetical protein